MAISSARRRVGKKLCVVREIVWVRSQQSDAGKNCLPVEIRITYRCGPATYRVAVQLAAFAR